MSPSIWTRCAGKSRFRTIAETAWRVVETQNQSATRKLVDSLHDHDILEEAIENAKPRWPTGPEWDSLHYLLRTPFRYPPLVYGSRFGARSMMGLWYGASNVETALCESAYYRFVFFSHSRALLSSETEHTVFSAKLKSTKAVDLCRAPFVRHRSQICSPTSYKASQALGSDMRTAGAEFAKYYSARTTEDSVNFVVFSPKAFASKTVSDSNVVWRCFATPDTVEFRKVSYNDDEVLVFQRVQFEVGGKLAVVS